MAHSFFDIFFSTQHYVNPFGCPCDDANDSDKHSLSTFQKVAVLAIPAILAISAMIVGGPAFGLIAIPTFFVLSAFLKARNSVWTIYNSSVYADRQRFFMFIPDWWGFSGSRIVVNPIRHQPQGSVVYVTPTPPSPMRPTHPHHPHHPLPAGHPTRNLFPNGGNAPVWPGQGRQIPGSDASRR